MQQETIRSILIDLLASGAVEVVNGQVVFNGQPLGEEVANSEYRSDGWSTDTSYGCRRHRAIDDFLKRLSRGDVHERKVAEQAYEWFCFHPRKVERLVAEDEEQAQQATRAYWNSNLLTRMLGGGTRRDSAVNYKLKAERWGKEDEAGGYWFMPPAHAVVHGAAPEEEAPGRWPEEYINDLKEQVEYHRSGQAERDEAWLR